MYRLEVHYRGKHMTFNNITTVAEAEAIANTLNGIAKYGDYGIWLNNIERGTSELLCIGFQSIHH